MKPQCIFKVSIIGLGHVGATAAFSMLLDGTPSELVLLARDKNKAIGEKLDLEHALPFLNYTRIIATDNYEDIQGSNLVVITAGAAQKPGQTRLDLIDMNIKIIDEIMPKILNNAPNATILIIANPVDVLTYRANQIAGTSENEQGTRIFGSGTMLDTARFRYHLSESLGVNSRSIHAYVLGEHGDTSFPVYFNATIGGQKLVDFPGFSEEKVKEAYQLARNAAYSIIEAKGATYYAIGVVATKIMRSIYSDARTVMPVSIPLHNYHGHSGVSLSVPCIIGDRGVEQVLNIDLSPEEEKNLEKSAKTLKEYCNRT